MKKPFRIISALLALIMTLSLLVGCVSQGQEGGGEATPPVITSLKIVGDETRELELSGICILEIDQPMSVLDHVSWSVEGDAVTVDGYGIVVAVKYGTATVRATYGFLSDSVTFNVVGGPDGDVGDGDGSDIGGGSSGGGTSGGGNGGTGSGSGNTGDGGSSGGENGNTGGGNGGALDTPDPYVGVTKDDFYSNYTPATSFADAYYRTQHGFLSGELEIPSMAPTVDENRPMKGGLYVRNTDMHYEDGGNTYVVYDSEGRVAFKVYRGAAYITLEEVAAYMFAFGGTDGAFPANYSSKKKPSPTGSIWGEYLRGNHSYFSGDTEQYPREPELPNIMGCGGRLQYWEMDIGSVGYNNGNKISRGACRIVYGRNDLDRDGVYEKGELHLFYTYNHYDDFTEYLNYKNGWGEIFGYETNGSSASRGPSPYVEVAYGSFTADGASVVEYALIIPPTNKRDRAAA